MSEHIHDENCEHDDEFIEIEDENGVVHQMVIAFSFELKEKEYAVMMDRNDAEADVMILRMDEVGEELLLSDIEDDNEWEEVLAEYNKIMEEEE